MTYRRHILSIPIVAAIAFGGYTAYQQVAGDTDDVSASVGSRGGGRAVAIEVLPAETHSLDLIQEAVGTTQALRSIDIVPHAEGRITDIAISAGTEVKTGTVLARLDDTIERATLSEADATLAERRRSLERSETLLRSNAVSTATTDQARSDLAIAQAEADRARQRLEDRVIRAPFDGVLGISSVDLGARVDTDTVLTTLDDLSFVDIAFRLPETVFGQIKPGQPVTAVSAAFPDQVFAGTVTDIDSRIDPVSRAFRVHAQLPNESRALPAGMFMRLSLVIGTRDAVTIPEEALLVQGRESYLFIEAGGIAERRVVETGLRRDGMVEIHGGVTTGELVITKGIQSLRDGSTVTIITPPDPDNGAAPSATPPPSDAAIDPLAAQPERQMAGAAS